MARKNLKLIHTRFKCEKLAWEWNHEKFTAMKAFWNLRKLGKIEIPLFCSFEWIHLEKGADILILLWRSKSDTAGEDRGGFSNLFIGSFSTFNYFTFTMDVWQHYNLIRQCRHMHDEREKLKWPLKNWSIHWIHFTSIFSAQLTEEENNWKNL